MPTDAPARPEVSVVMPVRDGASTLDAAVGSILSQSFRAVELLIVNDHSRDGSRERAAAHRARDARVRVIDNPGAGLIDALNAGVEAARAPFVARMDADDVAHPDRLALQHRFFHVRGNVDVVGTCVESFPRQDVREGYRIYERWLNALTEPAEIAREIYVESPIPHPTAFLRRDLLLEIGGYRDVGRPEDYDLWLRLHLAGRRFAKVPRVLHFWRDRPDRHSRTHPRYSVESFLRTKARYLAIGPLSARPAIVWGAGQIGRRLGRLLVLEGVAIDAYVDIDPKKIGRTRRGRPILAPDALAAPGHAVVLAAVGSRMARTLIRRRVAARGYLEGRDFFAVA